MRKRLSFVAFVTALGATVGGTIVVWRRDPRLGSDFVNSVVNPRLLGRGLAGGAKSEIGTLEHVGRTTGVRRLTPVHPEPTPGGFRIMVPLGPHSQWARNVLAAGHCRLQWHEVIYELDEPAMIPASEVHALPAAVRAGLAALGFEYLTLRTFRSAPGTLEPAEAVESVTGTPGVKEGSAAGEVREPGPVRRADPGEPVGRMVGEVGLEPTISCSQSTCVADYATPRRSHAQNPCTA